MIDFATIFAPPVQRWFEREVGTPTDIQERAWPVIAAGNHALVTAPTGSGKTLTAFLWALDQLMRGEWATGCLRVLYVSPMKALNNDIHRNLMVPLEGLQRYYRDAGLSVPEIEVMTRSGDSPANERRRLMRKAPEILITTPESLNILLNSDKAPNLFHGVRTVILDEIHAVLDEKRGVHLITAVERLVRYAGEFQRIALSATVRPLEVVATFVGGYRMTQQEEKAAYTPREVVAVCSTDVRRYEVSVRYPNPAHLSGNRAEWWPGLAAELCEQVRAARSTLLFTNNRRLCERLSSLINGHAGERIAYSHHGSLSRELRGVVEHRLKSGDLAAIVATNSLELGIDIGALDQVILVETPFTVTSSIQRIGRSGHSVGAVSRGVLYPSHGRDFLHAAVMARCVMSQDIEPVQVIENPLDILAQVLLAMTVNEIWNLDTLYNFIRTSFPFHKLSRAQFDRVVRMLEGRYAESRIRHLQARVSIDTTANTMQAQKSARMLLNLSGGTIPDRGYYHLITADSGGRIGELDEEFVWERRIGDQFTLGTQSWRITEITHNEVKVVPGNPGSPQAPFWKAEDLVRNHHYASRVAAFLEMANTRLYDDDFLALLQQEYAMEPDAAVALLHFLRRQREATGTDLPHRRHLLVELHHDINLMEETQQIVLHTLWGGKLNYPFAMALSAAWEQHHGTPLEFFCNNDAIALLVPESLEPGEVLSWVTPENLMDLLQQKLEATGFFGARFRENAARALLLPRTSFNRRMPLWLNRLRGKKLLAAVRRYDNFPILEETWRACLRDEFDLVALQARLEELRSGDIRWSQVHCAKPTPFSDGLVWRQVNQFMYEDDTPLQGGASSLSDAILKEIVFTAELRPQLSKELVESFQQRVQRLYPGYAPGSTQELLDWLKDRLYLPMLEFDALLAHCAQGIDMTEEALRGELHGKVLSIAWASEAVPRGVVTVDRVAYLQQAWGLPHDALRFLSLDGKAVKSPLLRSTQQHNNEGATLEAWLGEWLRYYGPVPLDWLQTQLPVSVPDLEAALSALNDAQEVILDRITLEVPGLEVCDRENLESLLRRARVAMQTTFSPLPIERLPLFFAEYQGLIHRTKGEEGVQKALESLMGYAAPVGLWESDLLPARVKKYKAQTLDKVMQDSGLWWMGAGRQKLFPCFSEDRELFVSKEENTDGGGAAVLFPDQRGQYRLVDLLDQRDLLSEELSEQLWDLVWEGKVSNNHFETFRQGAKHRYKPEKISQPNPSASRRERFRFSRWKGTRPFSGQWFALPPVPEPEDRLDAIELEKDRVRVLLRRYGILFRELLQRELPLLRWGHLFTALRVMELSGEVLTGRFFEGIPGVQFLAPNALKILQAAPSLDKVYWMNALDPVSLCGIDLEAVHWNLPRRVPGNWLVYHGTSLVLVVEKQGRSLDIRVPPDHPGAGYYLGIFKHLLKREQSPLRRIALETINNQPARTSPYLEALREQFMVDCGPKNVTVLL